MKKRLILDYPLRLSLCLMLVLLGACDSYNLPLQDFFDGPPSDPAKAITAFSITSPVSATGVINEGAKTIDVTVPYGTPVTGLIPAITHTGANVSPASGEARDFTSPVTYTVTAEDGSTAAYTVTVTVAANLDSITAIGDYLSDAGGGTTKDDPVILPPLNFNLAGGGWADLLDIIASQDPPKFVELDLSACTMDGTEFDPGDTSTGKNYVTALTLPDTTTSIAAGDYDAPTFKDFTNLAAVSGEGIRIIGGAAFKNCTALTTVDFPAATDIGERAFDYCTALESVSLPAATTIGDSAFNDCDTLATVNLPAVTSIDRFAFYSCTALTSLTLGITPPTLNVPFANTGYNVTTRLTIHVPPGRVSDYTDAWGVSDSTDAETNWEKYGSQHKEIIITDTP